MPKNSQLSRMMPKPLVDPPVAQHAALLMAAIVTGLSKWQTAR
ncbi:MAG: hypothetical protein AB8B97_09865 [Granulosicoccus sp.]